MATIVILFKKSSFPFVIHVPLDQVHQAYTSIMDKIAKGGLKMRNGGAVFFIPKEDIQGVEWTNGKVGYGAEMTGGCPALPFDALSVN